MKTQSCYGRIAAIFLYIIILFTLSACAIFDNPISKTIQHAVRWDEHADIHNFAPHFHYIRVVVGGRVIFLAMGNEDVSSNGLVEVWYSASKEVLRFQNGRLVGTAGLFTEWRNVSLPKLPAWSALAHAGQPFRWVRIRDIMPGYRYGVKDDLVLYVIPPPKKSELRNIAPEKLTWFEEDDVSKVNVLPPAKYAVDISQGVVVYGEICLASDLCLSWQRWPVSNNGKKDV